MYKCRTTQCTIALLIALLVAGCNGPQKLVMDEQVVRGYDLAAPMAPVAKDEVTTNVFWDHTIELGDGTTLRIIAGPKDPLRPATSRILIRFSDEQQDRDIWQFYAYSAVEEIRVLADRQILYYIIKDTLPWPNTQRRTILHAFDLEQRAAMGSSVMDSTPVDTIPP